MTGNYHIPVLLNPSMEGLDIKADGVYADLTFGGGGHSRAILDRLNERGRLIAFDQDPDAWENEPSDGRLVLVKHNFRFLENFLHYLDIPAVDGVLADLGVSSHHFDEPQRGFSYRYEGRLDMRMRQGSGLSAADVVNSYPAHKLKTIFHQYGELPSVNRLVRTLVDEREQQPLKTTSQLRALVEPLAPAREANKYMAQVFQALRIEVNGELDALRELLLQMPRVVKKGGRLVILSYHSLEDRMVKNFIRSGGPDTPQAEKDIYGHTHTPFKAVTRKAIQASGEETDQNPRARSVKLRVAERI